MYQLLNLGENFGENFVLQNCEGDLLTENMLFFTMLGTILGTNLGNNLGTNIGTIFFLENRAPGLSGS